MSEKFGIDVSSYQGSINWARVKANGKHFAILKATRKDNTTDKCFEANYVGCITNSIPVGVYRYVYATGVTSAKAEAEALVKVLKGKEIPYGVWLDMEDSSIKGLGKAKLTEIITTEAEILKANGYGVGIYCNRDWYMNVLDSSKLKLQFPFWVARYPSVDIGTYSSTSTLSPKAYASAWQYSSKGKVDGITGNVDLDIAYEDLPMVLDKGGTYYAELTLISALKAVGESDTSFARRKQIAVANGIKDYTGTAEQNISLRQKIIDGKLVKP